MLRVAPALRGYSEADLVRLVREGRAYLDKDAIVPFVSGATSLTNSFEGGTDGAGATGAITALNSGGGSGNAFNGLQGPAAGATLAYSKAQAHSGTLSLQVAMGGTASPTSVFWSTSRGSLTDDYIRSYWYCTNLPTVNGAQIRWYSGALAFMGSLAWTATGAWAIQDNTGAPVFNSTTLVPAGEWCRIEARKHADTSAGYINLRIFKGTNLEGSTPDEEVGTALTWADSAATSARVDFGMPGSAANQPNGGSWFLDDLAAGGADYWGPAPPQPRSPGINFQNPAIA